MSCLCVNPEDHTCAVCGKSSTDHFEDRYGRYCCGIRCKIISNSQIYQKEAEEYKDRWMPCCICRKNEVHVSEGYDTCGDCLARQ